MERRDLRRCRSTIAGALHRGLRGLALAAGSGIGLLAIVATAATARAEGSGSWPQAGYAAAHAGFNPTERTITAQNVGSLVEHWHVDGIASAGAPIVANGRVFVVGGPSAWAFSVEDGSQLWKQTYEVEDVCCSLFDPVITPQGDVLAELGWLGGGGALDFDSATGAFTGEPEFHGGSTNFAVRDSDVFSLTFGYGSGGPFFLGLSGPYEGFVYFGSFGARALGPTLVGRFAVVALDFQFTGSQGQLLGFDLDQCPNPTPLGSCSAAWSVPLATTGPYGATTPVAFGDEVAVATTNGVLSIYAAASGDLRWSGVVGSGVSDAPAVAHGRIFVPGERGVIRVFDADGCGSATCEPIGRFKLGSPPVGSPVVAGNVLYAGTRDGRLVAFRARGCGAASCEPRWSVDLGARIEEGPIVTGGRVYATTRAGRLIAYGLPES